YAGEVVSLADVRDVKFSPETSVQSDYDISNLVKINNDYLEIDLSQSPNSKFMLFNLIGENMLQGNQENANIKMFDLHTLPSGFYNLVIFNNNQLIFSKKIIVE
ncbi:MAG: T9SS type A sorting domain-containing protein, partial [Chloroherpetonaceae bacterium]